MEKSQICLLWFKDRLLDSATSIQRLLLLLILWLHHHEIRALEGGRSRNGTAKDGLGDGIPMDKGHVRRGL
jgi:hypothetical protein